MKKEKEKKVKAWAIAQEDTHIWGWGNGRMHIYPTKKEAKNELRDIGCGKILPCEIIITIPKSK